MKKSYNILTVPDWRHTLTEDLEGQVTRRLMHEGRLRQTDRKRMREDTISSLTVYLDLNLGLRELDYYFGVL